MKSRLLAPCLWAMALTFLVCGCGRAKEQPAAPPSPAGPPPPSAAAPVAPPPVATPPKESATVAEAPFSPTSAQGAADVVQTYFALIGEKKYPAARHLWGDEGQASGQDETGFARQFDAYADYRAEVGVPGEIEGAAGSLYVEVPVKFYGRRRDGQAFAVPGKVTLRRVNDVPGSSAEQRRWRIASIDPKAP